MKKKTAYCSLTYLFSFEPKELGSNSDSSVEDIYNAAAKKNWRICLCLVNVNIQRNGRIEIFSGV